MSICLSFSYLQALFLSQSHLKGRQYWQSLRQMEHSDMGNTTSMRHNPVRKPETYILLNKSLARINKNWFYLSKWLKVIKHLLRWWFDMWLSWGKQLVYFNCISTASFITLNKRGVKNVFQLQYWQYKIITASVFKVLCFQAWWNQPFC